jgi:hypothetical protein
MALSACIDGVVGLTCIRARSRMLLIEDEDGMALIRRCTFT